MAQEYNLLNKTLSNFDVSTLKRSHMGHFDPIDFNNILKFLIDKKMFKIYFLIPFVRDHFLQMSRIYIYKFFKTL